MPLDKKWATPEDFATLFQYFWYRDFPIDQKAIGAHRADWTIHIGIVVRNVADLMGLVTRFEYGGRTDAVLRSTEGDEIAVEWEWKGLKGNELEKLKNHAVNREDATDKSLFRYAVLITYSNTIKEALEDVRKRWEGASVPLLCILIDLIKSKKYASGREFKNMHISVFDENGHREIRVARALPWEVKCTRWSIEHVGQWK